LSRSQNQTCLLWKKRERLWWPEDKKWRSNRR